jgi:hypothetical protein
LIGGEDELAEAEASVAGGNLGVSENAAAGVGETGFKGGGEDGVEEDSAAEADAIEAGALDEAVNGQHAGMLAAKTAVGGTRIIPMQIGEQIPRIC